MKRALLYMLRDYRIFRTTGSNRWRAACASLR